MVQPINNMELLKVIEERRSIRKYTEQKVEKQLVEDILNCGRLAPSAKNRQPWHFVIVKSDIKNKIADIMIEFVEKNKNSDEYYLERISSVIPTANVIKQAQVLILIFREKNDSWLIGDNLSIGACVENMCLRATDLGIGSLWIRDTAYVSEDIANLVNHSNEELNCVVALGYPDQSPKMRPRKNLEDIIEWI